MMGTCQGCLHPPGDTMETQAALQTAKHAQHLTHTSEPRSGVAVGRAGHNLLPGGMSIFNKAIQKGAGQTNSRMGAEPLFLHQDPKREDR